MKWCLETEEDHSEEEGPSLIIKDLGNGEDMGW